MTELKALVYVSSATELLSDQALDELLQGARSTNERIGVTGVLLHCEGNFMQYVEGPRSPSTDCMNESGPTTDTTAS